MNSLTLAEINTRPKTCLQCGSLFKIVYPGERDEQIKIWQTRVDKGMVPTIKLIEEITHCHLRDAKGTAMHITVTPGKCHRCQNDIIEEKFVDCPRCRALNVFLDSDTLG
jgi:hypothetical protein